MWFADASGMSKATGTMNLASGRFHLTLTSLDGQGPIGEVDGTKDPTTGVVTAVLDGPGCSKLKLPPTNPYVRKADGTDDTGAISTQSTCTACWLLNRTSCRTFDDRN